MQMITKITDYRGMTVPDIFCISLVQTISDNMQKTLIMNPLMSIM